MGHRANFVIIRDGAATAYYDQWAATGCVYGLADGPAEAAAMVEPMEPTDELLDWAFAEGGYLLDFDLRSLVAFGYPESIYASDLEALDEADLEGLELPGSEMVERLAALDAALMRGPEHFLALLAASWPGWRLVWDERGVDAFAAHLRERGITTIRCQPEEAREPRSRVELQA